MTAVRQPHEFTPREVKDLWRADSRIKQADR